MKRFKQTNNTNFCADDIARLVRRDKHLSQYGHRSGILSPANVNRSEKLFIFAPPLSCMLRCMQLILLEVIAYHFVHPILVFKCRRIHFCSNRKTPVTLELQVGRRLTWSGPPACGVPLGVTACPNICPNPLTRSPPSTVPK